MPRKSPKPSAFGSGRYLRHSKPTVFRKVALKEYTVKKKKATKRSRELISRTREKSQNLKKIGIEEDTIF